MNGHAVVLGAGVAGLLAARVLTESYERVTVVDRDDLAGPGHRRGVPQGRHVHGLQPRGLQVLEELFPGLTAELVDGGAVRGRMRTYLSGHLLCPVGGRKSVFCGRPFLEHRIRARVTALPGLAVVAGTAAVGLTTTAGRVSGVRLAGGGYAGIMGADLVVDATGRGSRTPRWLAELGYPPPREDRIEIGLGYATRSYLLAPGALTDAAAVLVGPTRQLPRAALLAALEDGRHLVTAAGLGGDLPPTDTAGFDAFLAGLPADDLHRALRGARPVDAPVRFRFPRSVRRRYERLPRFPDGLLVTGDAVCSFNPIYGQGMSVAALEAVALRAQPPGRPRAREHFRRLAAIIEPPWQLAAGGDLAFPAATGRRTPWLRLLNAYLPRLHAAAAHDPDLAVAVLRVTGLIDPPAALLHPRHLLRVMAATGPVARHGSREPAPLAPG